MQDVSDGARDGVDLCGRAAGIGDGAAVSVLRKAGGDPSNAKRSRDSRWRCCSSPEFGPFLAKLAPSRREVVAANGGGVHGKWPRTVDLPYAWC